jgi:hypothetical protein
VYWEFYKKLCKDKGSPVKTTLSLYKIWKIDQQLQKDFNRLGKLNKTQDKIDIDELYFRG